jgi:hypothetical protein
LRIAWGALAFGVWTTTGACASSFVHVAPPTEKISRSFVVFVDKDAERATTPVAARQATPAPRTVVAAASRSVEPVKVVAISASIVAFESPAPAVTFEKVAAIQNRSTIRAQPILIRGGIVEGMRGTVSEPVQLTPSTPTKRSTKAKTTARTQVSARQSDPAGTPSGPSRPVPEPIEAAAPPPSRPVLAPR